MYVFTLTIDLCEDNNWRYFKLRNFNNFFLKFFSFLIGRALANYIEIRKKRGKRKCRNLIGLKSCELLHEK